MRKRIGVTKQLLVGACLGLLPALTAVGGRMGLIGHADSYADAAPVPAAVTARPEIRVGGAELPNAGVPCRRSAGDAVPEAMPKHGMAPKSGCNLRLIKRRPGDSMIWV